MTNGRGHRVHVDGPSIDWAGVVIIDHPDPPDDYATPATAGDVPHVVLLHRDWEFLFDQLRSTHAVVSYLHRIDASTEKLGTEPERYYELAAADAAAPPGPLDPALEGTGDPRSVPILPTAPAGIDDNAHSIVRTILEDIATTDIDPDRPLHRPARCPRLHRKPAHRIPRRTRASPHRGADRLPADGARHDLLAVPHLPRGRWPGPTGLRGLLGVQRDDS